MGPSYHTKSLLLLCIIHFAFLHAFTQPVSFNHVNTSHGLSDNNVLSIAIDRSGFLWIGTNDGLNVFDGYHVTVFKKDAYPELASNHIIHLTCDKRNRIWLGTYEGVTWVDENRNLHRVVLNDSVTKFGCRTILDTKTYGPVLYTSLGQYFFNEKRK